MRALLALLTTFSVSSQVHASINCQELLVGHEPEIKILSTIVLPGRLNSQVALVNAGDHDLLNVVHKDSGKITVVEIGEENGRVIEDRFLGGAEGSLNKTQIHNGGGMALVAGIRNSDKTLIIEDALGVIGRFTVPVTENIRQWRLVSTSDQTFLVVTTHNSLIVLQLKDNQFQVKSELRNLALFTSLEVLPDGSDIMIVAKGDLRVHIFKFDTMGLQLIRHIVQLGGDVVSTLTDEGDLVFASIDRADRMVNFYSLNKNRRSQNFAFEEEIGRGAWLQVSDAGSSSGRQHIFVLNSGSRMTSNLTLFSSKTFEKIEKMPLQTAAIKGAVDHLSAVEMGGRNYFVFCQQGRCVRMVNHVDEKLMESDLGTDIRQVTSPVRLKDGRIAVAVVTTGSKSTKIQIIQLGR